MSRVTDSKGVGLLPGYGRPPGVESHLLRQRFRHSQQDEADVSQSNQCGHQNHQVVPIPGWQVRSDGRTRHQAGCKSSRHLEQKPKEQEKEKEKTQLK